MLLYVVKKAADKLSEVGTDIPSDNPSVGFKQAVWIVVKVLFVVFVVNYILF